MTHNIISVNPLPKPIRAEAPIDGASEPAPVSHQPKPRRITWGDQAASNETQSAESSVGSVTEPSITAQRRTRDLTSTKTRTERSKEHYRAAQRQSSSTSDTLKIQVEQIERNSKLERMRQLRLQPDLLEQRTQQGNKLEHLSIRYNSNTQRFWLADAQTGRPLTAQAFATLKHCQEAALELEHTFAMSDVLRLRSPETMERIEELLQMHRFRELLSLQR
ncbi:MAG TPA: hypothetical protein V6D19_14920 [Stenomitos sp.]